MKKFRSSFQVSRPPREDGERPSTAMHFKFPSLLEKQSKASLVNGASEAKEEAPREHAKTTPTKKAMQDFLQKTGDNLRATGANLKATSARLERRIPRRKSNVVRRCS